MMRIVLIGQQWFGAEAFRLCRRLGHEIVGVSAPLRPDGRTDRLRAQAEAACVSIAGYTGRYMLLSLMAGKVDLVVAAHAHTFIPAAVSEKARLGAIAYHPSLLPRHRGRDAVRWAIHVGDRVTGGTIYRMTDQVDGGPILAQDWCWIRPGDTPADLWRRDLAPMGLRLIERVLGELERGALEGAAQDESLATWEPAFARAPLSASS